MKGVAKTRSPADGRTVAKIPLLLARALPGKPVRVQWMREDEHAWEPFGPAMLSKARAALDAAGDVSGFQYDVWSNTHSSRPGKAGELAAAWSLAKPFQPSAPRPIPSAAATVEVSCGRRIAVTAASDTSAPHTAAIGDLLERTTRSRLRTPNKPSSGSVMD